MFKKFLHCTYSFEKYGFHYLHAFVFALNVHDSVAAISENII